MLRCERFAGLRVSAYVLAKVAVMVPLLAVADLVVLAVPGISGRLAAGPAFVAVLCASLAGFAAMLARTVRSAVAPHG
jgi:hypothetical protein